MEWLRCPICGNKTRDKVSVALPGFIDMQKNPCIMQVRAGPVKIGTASFCNSIWDKGMQSHWRMP